VYEVDWFHTSLDAEQFAAKVSHDADTPAAVCNGELNVKLTAPPTTTPAVALGLGIEALTDAGSRLNSTTLLPVDTSVTPKLAAPTVTVNGDD
jgi:hypothetical protein